MRKIPILISAIFILFSCNNKEAYEKKMVEDQKHLEDSINARIQKQNDRIAIKNKTNKLKDLEGDHVFTMATDGISTLKGSANFKKINADEYEISGSARSGKNSITINGIGKLKMSQNIYFEGEIIQNITENGGKFTRNGKQIFHTEGNNTSWTLKDKVNKEGFVDHIDIHFK